MEWQEYKKEFLEQALKKKKSPKYCEKWLEYAQSLFNQNLPIIYTRSHFCRLVGYEPLYVFGAAEGSIKFYRQFKIAKKSGGYREISEPLPSLKEIQRWILDNILTNLSVSGYAKAFRKDYSIKDNAVFHCRHKFVLSLDIKDYFGSIKEYTVFSFFNSLGYNKNVSMFLTKLCTLRGCLPQGAPTSPALSNLITKNMDIELAKIARLNKLFYTRYADDMTFSGNVNPSFIISRVRKIVKKYGFSLNDEKTRIRNCGQQQEVTGIVVNEKMHISKRKRKEIRQVVYYVNKYGLEDHINKIGEEREGYLNHLLGLIGFALFVNPEDEKMHEYMSFITGLYKDSVYVNLKM